MPANPVDRTAWHYLYWTRQAAPQHESQIHEHVIENHLTLEQFVRLPFVQDFYGPVIHPVRLAELVHLVTSVRRAVRRRQGYALHSRSTGTERTQNRSSCNPAYARSYELTEDNGVSLSCCTPGRFDRFARCSG